MEENTVAPPASSYRLSTQDATFIYGESRNGPLHIGSIGLFEGRMDFNAILGHFEERIHLVPRYRQRLIEVPFNVAHALMEDDPEFSLDNHIFHHELPEGMTEADGLGEMMRIYQTPVDRKHPLWELHVFANLEGNRTALVWKVHHSLVDGVSGVELLKVMYDIRAEPEDFSFSGSILLTIPSIPAKSIADRHRYGFAVESEGLYSIRVSSGFET